MTLVRWDPFKDVSSLQDRINRMFEDFFPRPRDLNGEAGACAWQPAVDIYECENGMILQADLPGVARDDVTVELRDNILTLRGERRIEKAPATNQYYRRERCFGPFQRIFTLPAAVHPDKIRARFKDGILEIEIPRIKEPAPRSVSVNIE